MSPKDELIKYVMLEGARMPIEAKLPPVEEGVRHFKFGNMLYCVKECNVPTVARAMLCDRTRGPFWARTTSAI